MAYRCGSNGGFCQLHCNPRETVVQPTQRARFPALFHWLVSFLGMCDRVFVCLIVCQCLSVSVYLSVSVECVRQYNHFFWDEVSVGPLHLYAELHTPHLNFLATHRHSPIPHPRLHPCMCGGTACIFPHDSPPFENSWIYPSTYTCCTLFLVTRQVLG